MEKSIMIHLFLACMYRASDPTCSCEHTLHPHSVLIQCQIKYSFLVLYIIVSRGGTTKSGLILIHFFTHLVRVPGV